MTIDDKTREVVERLAKERDADVILLNGEMYPPLDLKFIKALELRKKRPNVILIYVTPGGMPDVSYRIGRCLQNNYKHVSIVISGWCKSAGTILCTGAHELIFSVHGELGPIDVQIRREDELGERDSGLSIESAFDSLYKATFKLFEDCMLEIKDHSYGSITFRTAAEIASNMAVGMVSPIFSQLDPIKIGETHRSVRISEEYAKRLAMISRNLRATADFNPINMLLRGYPAHGFVIDRQEAEMIFRNVSKASGNLKQLVENLGDRALYPVTEESGTGPIMEYLNDEPTTGTKKASTAPRKTKGQRRSSANGASANADGGV